MSAEAIVEDEAAIQVFHWRVRQLLDLRDSEGHGFTLRQARRLANMPDVGHEAEHLLKRGCLRDTAFIILLS